MTEPRFPKDFSWGVATSAYQIEGSPTADWTEWAKQGKVPPAGQGTGHWARWRQDFKLLKELHVNSYRMSLEWSRLEPQEGVWDIAAEEHYRKMLVELRKMHIEPMVTLHHFTNPAWTLAYGGWQSVHVMQAFHKYVQRCMNAFGGLVKYWVTFNEPLHFILHGFILGDWPPGKKGVGTGLAIGSNLHLAHTRAAHTIRKAGGLAGIAHATNDLVPARSIFDAPLLWWVKKLVRYLDLSSEVLLTRIFPTHDFIGINYYTRARLGWRFPKGAEVHECQNCEVSDLKWEIYPEGLHRVIRSLGSHGKPVYITENGIADARDKKRPAFIKDHLDIVNHAIQEGVDIRGYSYWSLMDNYEWHEGYWPRFGLYRVDYKTFRRTPRPSARLYANICRTNGAALNHR